MRRSFIQRSRCFAGTKYRIQERGEIIRAAPESRSREPSADDGEHGENYERAKHGPWRFVHVDVMLVVALFAREGEIHQAEHIKGGEQRGEQADGVERMAAGNLKRAEQDSVFAEECRQGRD